MSESRRRERGVRGGPTWAVGYVAFPRRFSVTWALLTAALTTACGGSDSTTAPPREEEPDAPSDRTAVSIDFRIDSVRPMGMLGVTFRVSAIGVTADGSYTTGRFPVWSTDTPDVLEVTPEGDVTSLSEGEGRAIARLDGVQRVLRVPVREVARLEWQASLGESAFATKASAIGPDGTIYVSGTPDLFGTVHQSWAFDPGGAVRWSKLTPTQYTEPAIGADGTLYVGTLNFDDGVGELVAMGPDGSILWRLPRPGSIDVPVLGEDGTLFALEREIFGNTDVELTLLAVDAASGEILWEYQPEERRTALAGALAVGPDNTVYFRRRNSVVHAVSGEGEPLWTVQLGEEEELMYGSLAVGADGTIYGGTKAGRLYALNPEDGSVRWSLELGYQLIDGAAIGADGTIYQVADGAELFAISPGGEVLWTWRMNGVQLTSDSPVIGGDGTLYIGGRGVAAIRPDGTLKWDFSHEGFVRGVPSGVALTAPAIGLDGTIYLVSRDGVLHAIRELEENNGGFDASPWPVWRGNRQNTGRAGP